MHVAVNLIPHKNYHFQKEFDKEKSKVAYIEIQSKAPKRISNHVQQTSFPFSRSWATRWLKFKAAWNISSSTCSCREGLLTFHNKNWDCLAAATVIFCKEN